MNKTLSEISEANSVDSATRLEETKRTARILEIILMIAAAPQRYQRKTLADHFGISVRMIGKDLEIIRHGMKLPLESTRNGFLFTHTPRLPLLQLGFAEALAVLNAVRAGQGVSGIGSPDLAAAVARLEALFPNEIHTLLKQVSQPTPATEQRQHRQRMLALVDRALLERSKLWIIYVTGSRSGTITERVVHPYHVLPHVRSWQLIAYCERRQEVRMFKVDRIQQAKILPATYRISEDFELDRYMGGAWGAMRGDPATAERVLLRFSPEAGRWVAEEEWHPSQIVERLDTGEVLFQVYISVTPEFVNWVMYYGAQVLVLEPEHLRETVMNSHRSAFELYSHGG
ncbi:MAG: WYL domain-containing protein [Caldilineaceae bacterium]|nr:WYL domain-containing protein [Caldilineaceae bacterium]